MRKLLFLLSALLLGAFAAHGQGAATNTIFGPNVAVRPNVQVTVCTHPSTVSSCTANKVPLFSDLGLTAPTTNPTTTNAQGQFLVYVASGTYDYIVTGTGITPQAAPYTFTVGGGGGGGSTPVAPANAIQLSNAAVSSLATASVGGNALGVDSVSSPTKLSIPFNAAISGPRPWIDVTAPPYNADPTGVIDSTGAIQAAITAACGMGSTVPTVLFPAGTYKATQPQTGSPTSPIASPCFGLLIRGEGSASVGQFGQPPNPLINVQCGVAPNTMPAFNVTTNDITFRDIRIAGCNQALRSKSANLTLENAYLSAQTTGLANNTAWELDNSIFVNARGGALATFSTSVPVLILNSVDSSNSGVYSFSDMQWSGGTPQFIINVSPSNGVIGTLSFRNIPLENCLTGDFLDIPSAAGGGEIVNVIFNNVSANDCPSTGYLLNNQNPNVALLGITVQNSAPGLIKSVTTSTAIKTQGWYFDNPVNSSRTVCQDGSGAPAGGCTATNDNGYDFTVDNNGGNNLRLKNAMSWHQGPAVRIAQKGQLLAGLGLDWSGIYFGDSSNFNFGEYIGESGVGNIGLFFGWATPPLSLGATPTTGGTIPPATYYYSVRACSSAGCGASMGMATQGVQAIVGGANNAVTLTWSAPASFLSAPAAYRIQRTTLGPGTGPEVFGIGGGSCVAAVVNGATTFTDLQSNMTAPGSCDTSIPAYFESHRFTQNALGINTTSPVANAISLGVGGFLGSITHANTANRVYTLPDATGTICLTSTCGGGAAVDIKTNGTDNSLQSLLNFVNPSAFQGLSFTWSNPSGGIETFGVTGTLNNGGLTNSSTTVNGQPCTLGSPCTLTLASSNFANQGTSIHSLLHGNPAGNPSWGAVDLTADVSGLLPNANLANPSTTVNGQTCTLGSNCTVTAVPSGSAGGDLSGTYPNPAVAKINGNSAPSGAANNQVYVGTGANTFGLSTLVDCNGGSNAENYTAATHSFSCNNIATLSNPMTTIGDRIGGGASGAATRIVGGLTGQMDVAVNGGVGGFASPGLAGRTVSGTTDTILCDSGTAVRDRMTTITYTSTSNVAITVPSAAATGCGSNTQGDNNFAFGVIMVPASGSPTFTFTPTTSTLTIVDGATVTTAASSVVLTKGQYATFSSPDNVNYIVRLTTAANACPTCVTSASSLTNNQIMAGAGGQGSKVSDLSGDVTTSGSLATTVGKVNGGSVPASAAVIGSNSSSQLIAATGHSVVAPIQCADTSASATTYTCTTTPSLGALTTGDTFILTGINQNNSGSSTLNIDSIGAKTIKKWQNTANLAAGDLQASASVLLRYDGTNLELDTIGNAPTTGTVTSIATTSPITGGTITTTGTIACATCVAASSPGVGIAHFAGSTQTVTSSAIVGADMTNNTVTATQLAAQYSKKSCSFGMGDGTNAVTAATYPTSGQMLQCVNNSGVTWTITGIHCFTDNAGTSTINAYNNAGTSLLTGAITCNATKTSGGAAGTQSATTTIATTDGLNFVFVADGTSKYVTATVDFTY